MKKKALIIYGWIILSILCQVFAYTMIDKVYLKNRKNIVNDLKVKTIDSSGSQTEEKEISIDIPSQATNIKVSFDGSYVAYILDKKLNIVDVNTKETKKVIDNYFITKDNSQNKIQSNITTFKWIPYKNMIVFAMSSLPNAGSRGQVYFFDLESGNIHISKNVMFESYIPRGASISDVIISPNIMAYYIRISGTQNSDKFYRVDIMDDIYPSITTPSSNIAKTGYYTDDLFYTDGDRKIILKAAQKSAVSMTLPEKQILLGMGGNSKDTVDIIYSGVVNSEGKVTKIIYGKHSTDVSTWKTISINSPLSPEAFIVKDEDRVYAVESNNSITELISGKKVSFKGDFIDITDTQVVYLSDGKLKLKTIQ